MGILRISNLDTDQPVAMIKDLGKGRIEVTRARGCTDRMYQLLKHVTSSPRPIFRSHQNPKTESWELQADWYKPGDKGYLQAVRYTLRGLPGHFGLPENEKFQVGDELEE